MDRGNIEGMLRSLMATPQGAKVAENVDRLKWFADSPDGRALIAQLGGPNGDALKSTLQAAANGDRDAASKLIATLMSTPDGARFAASLLDILK